MFCFFRVRDCLRFVDFCFVSSERLLAIPAPGDDPEFTEEDWAGGSKHKITPPFACVFLDPY